MRKNGTINFNNGYSMSLIKKRKKRNLIIGGVAFLGIFGLTYLAGKVFLEPDNSNAVTSISASVMSSGYYIEVSSLSDVQIAVLASPGGTVASADDTVTVKTNTSGYKLYLSTDSTEANSNKLYYNGDKTSSYALDPTESTSLSDNSWGFSTDNGATYRAVPIKGQEIMLAEKNNLTAETASENNHTVKYGIKANLGVPAGRYNGYITYSVVANASNQANLAGIFPSRVVWQGETGDVEVTIETPMMTNMDYGDWKVTVGSTEYNATAIKSTNSTMTLKFNMPYNTLAGTYAVTASNAKFGTYSAGNIEFQRNDLYSISTMQEMTPQVCQLTATPHSGATISATTSAALAMAGVNGDGLANQVPENTLTDTRAGNKTYKVRKLADGNCWMVEDLKLNLTAGTPVDVYDSATDTVLSWTPKNTTQVNDFQPKWNAESDYTTDRSVTTNNNYGNLYNWNAATGGTGDQTKTNRTTSICPKGWKLPDNAGNDSFQNLSTTYNVGSTGSRWTQAPLDFRYSGYYYYSGGRSAAYSRGSDGNYWSATSNNEANAYRLNFDSGNSTPQGNRDKRNGFSVRCVARR